MVASRRQVIPPFYPTRKVHKRRWARRFGMAAAFLALAWVVDLSTRFLLPSTTLFGGGAVLEILMIGSALYFGRTEPSREVKEYSEPWDPKPPVIH